MTLSVDEPEYANLVFIFEDAKGSSSIPRMRHLLQLCYYFVLLV